MFTLAASLVLVQLACASQEKNLSKAELQVEEQVRASVAVLTKNAKPQGMAVLIDSRGYFLAHRLSVRTNSIGATMPNGRTLILKMIQQDDPSQMVLLKANDWKQNYGAPVNLISENCKVGDKIIAIMPSGIARAEFTNPNLFGIISENRRMVPLSEIKLEAPVDLIGGSAVFTMDGDLIGIVGAALKQTDKFNTSAQQRGAQQSVGSGFGGNSGIGGGSGGPAFNGLAAFKNTQQFGPASLTIAYVAGPSIMARVIKGFTSHGNQVEHPTIGIYCRDSLRGGALIDNVIPNSPAEKAGVRVGDILIEIGGAAVRNQLDFAKAMINQSVGQTIVIRVIRNKELLSLRITIGK